MKTGEELYSLPIRGDIVGSFALSGGAGIVGSRTGGVYCLGLGSQRTHINTDGVLVTVIIAASVLLLIFISAYYCQRISKRHIDKNLSLINPSAALSLTEPLATSTTPTTTVADEDDVPLLGSQSQQKLTRSVPTHDVGGGAQDSETY